MKELYAKAVYRLADILPEKFDELIREQIKLAGGLLSSDAAAALAADKMGIRASTNQVMVQDNAWTYSFTASIRKQTKRTET